MNHWEFSGRVESAKPMTFKNGKGFTAVVLVGEGKALCACECWGTAPAPGQCVEARGTIKGREWNGKVFSDLKMEEWRPAGQHPAVAGPQDKMPPFETPDAPPLTDAKEDEDIPF